MAYLKPINPMWNSYRSAYWLCEVSYNGVFNMSYPVYPRNKYYSGIYKGSNVRYNPRMFFSVLNYTHYDTTNLYYILYCLSQNMLAHENYNAPYLYYDWDWLAKMFLAAILLHRTMVLY